MAALELHECQMVNAWEKEGKLRKKVTLKEISKVTTANASEPLEGDNIMSFSYCFPEKTWMILQFSYNHDDNESKEK